MTRGKSQNTEESQESVDCRLRHCSGNRPGDRRLESGGIIPTTFNLSPVAFLITYQAGQHLSLWYKGKGLHIKPLIVIRMGHRRANWMKGSLIVVQVVFTTRRHTPAMNQSHACILRIQFRIDPNTVMPNPSRTLRTVYTFDQYLCYI